MWLTPEIARWIVDNLPGGGSGDRMMPTLTLVRFAKTRDGVLGRLGPFCTLEEESQGNRPNVSCIPPGAYKCVRSRFHRGGYNTFEVTGVPGRSRILFHAGNTEEDVEGCILLGSTFGALIVEDEDTDQRVPKLAVLNSRAAFNMWMTSLRGVNEFMLRITEA